MSENNESMNDINQQFVEIFEQADLEGWSDQTLADNLAALNCSVDEKFMGYRRYMDRLEVQASLAEAEKKVYTEQAKPYGERAKSLNEKRKRVTYPLLNFFYILLEKGKLKPDKKGKVSITGGFGTFYLKNNPDKLRYKEADIPQRFKKRELRFVPDEEAIKAALDAGEKLDFAWYEKQPQQVILRKF